jgi:AraC-like DNA-binding protein
MLIEHHLPDVRLRAIVAAYQSRAANMAHILRVPLPARTEAILEFYFTRPHLVELQKTGAREHAPWAVVVGPQTWRRVDLLLSGRMDVFTVRFRPTGLYRLFGLPISLLPDQAVPAADLLGRQAAEDLHDRLHAAPTLAAKAAVMDAALLDRLRSLDVPDPIGAAAARLHRTQGAANLRALSAASGLSERQFRRQFTAQIGMAPKLYGRVVRLQAALELKRQAPLVRWTEIAHRFGWHDQAHLDKDFQDLAGASPTAFFQRP